MTGWMESLAGRLSLPARHAWRLELLAAAGALVGIVVTALLSGLVARAAFPLIVAPIGASAVLLFAVPASPLAQPWSIVGGNTVSALVGVGVSMLVPNVALAAGMAVALAIAVMVLTRSLHPPGGAAALTAVLVHPSSAGLSAALLFPFLPVALNSVVLVAVGLLFHTLTRRRYPHGATPPVARPASSVATAPLAPPSAAPAPMAATPIAATPAAAASRAAISGGSTLGGSTSGGTISGPAAPAPLTLADIEAALAAMDDTFDIDPDDLRQLLNLAEQNARRRSAHS
ncbi:MAG: HPP family protein [Acetobacter sp.]|uniref:HPP family protein n=1 Tax=Acetobacter sp. TaxID=440 RepID=UPI0039E8482B